jgi:hypothetical protein
VNLSWLSAFRKKSEGIYAVINQTRRMCASESSYQRDRELSTGRHCRARSRPTDPKVIEAVYPASNRPGATSTGV